MLPIKYHGDEKVENVSISPNCRGCVKKPMGLESGPERGGPAVNITLSRKITQQLIL